MTHLSPATFGEVESPKTNRPFIVEMSSITGINLETSVGLEYTIADIERQTYLKIVAEMFRQNQMIYINKVMQFLADHRVKLGGFFVKELFRLPIMQFPSIEARASVSRLVVQYPNVFVLTDDVLRLLTEPSSQLGDYETTLSLASRASPNCADASVLSTHVLRAYAVAGNDVEALLVLYVLLFVCLFCLQRARPLASTLRVVPQKQTKKKNALPVAHSLV